MVHKIEHNACVLRQGGRSYEKTEYPYATILIVDRIQEK